MLRVGFGPDADQGYSGLPFASRRRIMAMQRTHPTPLKVNAMPDLTFWLTLAVLGMAVALSIVQGRSKDQLGRVERKLDLLLKHARIDAASVADREAAEFLRAGRKIEAIRAYRGLTGAGLAEAKEAVERLERGEGGGTRGPG
jgi:hypothetical protein